MESEKKPGEITPHDGGDWTKFRGKDWLPDNDVLIDKDGNITCTGGPCRLLPESQEPRGLWPIPDDLKDLPGIEQCK